jgi:hypothetical protein
VSETSTGPRRGPLDRPILDWVVAAVLVVVVVRWTPLVAMFVATDQGGQRSAMGSTASLLGSIAAFGVAALFAYSALDNPTTRKIRARWGGHLAGTFIRGLGTMFLAAAVAGFCQVSVPNPAGTIVFFSSVTIGTVKLLRVLLVVAALLGGQRQDTSRSMRPVARVRDEDPEDRSA